MRSHQDYRRGDRSVAEDFPPPRITSLPAPGLSAVEVAERTAAGLANVQPRHSPRSLAAVAHVVIGLVQEYSAKRTRDRIALLTGENDPVPDARGRRRALGLGRRAAVRLNR